jgi:hypothetical protein
MQHESLTIFAKAIQRAAIIAEAEGIDTIEPTIWSECFLNFWTFKMMTMKRPKRRHYYLWPFAIPCAWKSAAPSF